MEISRHAKNRMRRHGASLDEVFALIHGPPRDHDERGNPRWTGRIRGEGFRVVVAADDPDMIIAFHPRRKL